MAIRQVTAGVPVYSIEVEVPKPTDSRGKGYGSLVSDLRWKLWEEVQQSQLQQMKFEQMSRQAQLDVLEQQQRDISRAIRDANELAAKIKAGGTSAGNAASTWVQVQKANQVVTTTRREPARDPFTGEILPGQTVETVTTKQPTPIGAPPMGYAPSGEQAAEAQKSFEQQQAELDKYIKELEAQQTELGTRFSEIAGKPMGPDLLSRTRGAFQSQIGEGGFGIGRRPLRQLPRFDELEAVGLIQDTIAREEDALLQEAQRRTGAPLTLQQEQDVRKLARDRLRQQMDQAGAEPTSRAGFLMKPPPPYEGMLPKETTAVPTGRFRDEFGVEGAAPLTREQEVIRDIGRGRTNYEKGFRTELEDIQATEAATKQVAETPLEYTTRRRVEMEAMGATPAEMAAQPTEAQILAIENQRKLDEARLARDRGFQYPTADISGFRQGVMGRPGGIADRMVANRLLSQRETPGALPGSGQMESTPRPPVPSQSNVEDIRFMGGEVLPPTPPTPTPPEIVPEYETAPEKKTKVPARGELPPMDDNLPESPIEPQGKLSVPARRERYAMMTIKKGLELADKPKQFARVAKTSNPSTAPEYVRIVNGVYEMNSSRPDRFKASYDEVARVYKDDPKSRELALSYLVAKDAIESNVTKPVA